MKHSVHVSLSNGKTISFGSDIENIVDIKNSILSSSQPWYYYKNSGGQGYFLKGEVVLIEIKTN